MAGLSEAQLDAKHRNWPIRQIVHHVADSHVNSYIRFKWTLTEESPTIKAYDEALWRDLLESRTGKIDPSLQLLSGLHARCHQLLESMTPDQFDQRFLYPQTGESISLNSALAYYAWHGRRHAAQILWICANRI